jgi:hypothetical protein
MLQHSGLLALLIAVDLDDGFQGLQVETNDPCLREELAQLLLCDIGRQPLDVEVRIDAGLVPLLLFLQLLLLGLLLVFLELLTQNLLALLVIELLKVLQRLGLLSQLRNLHLLRLHLLFRGLHSISVLGGSTFNFLRLQLENFLGLLDDDLAQFGYLEQWNPSLHALLKYKCAWPIIQIVPELIQLVLIRTSRSRSLNGPLVACDSSSTFASK